MDKMKYFEGVASYKLLAKKEVGQNFLADPGVAERIVSLSIFKKMTTFWKLVLARVPYLSFYRRTGLKVT
jgi:hypothetical protein